MNWRYRKLDRFLKVRQHIAFIQKENTFSCILSLTLIPILSLQYSMPFLLHSFLWLMYHDRLSSYMVFIFDWWRLFLQNFFAKICCKKFNSFARKYKRLTSKIGEYEFLREAIEKIWVAIMTKPFSCNLMPLTIFFQLHHHDICCLERAFRVWLRAKFARRPRFRR